MQAKSSQSPTLKSHKAGITSAMRCFVVVMFGLLLAWEQAAALGNQVPIHQHASNIVPANSAHGLQHPGRLVYGVMPTSQSSDTGTEVESEDDVQEDFSVPCCNHSSEFVFSNSVKKLLSNFSDAIIVRNRVPIFILLHSWRSFLS